MHPGQALLSNVSPETANLLSYIMLVIVAIFLVSGPVIVYIYYKKNKSKAEAPAVSSPQTPG